MSASPLIAVQAILAGGEEAELRFELAWFRLDGGCLSVFVQGASGEELLAMAFAPSAWRGAWIIDSASGDQRRPLGLQSSTVPSAAAAHQDRPASPPAAPRQDRPASPPAAPRQDRPVSAPASSPAEDVAGPRAERQRRALEALALAPYEGLIGFSARAGMSPEDAEWALSNALGQSRLSPSAVEIPAIQTSIDQHLPTILRDLHPRKISDMLSALRAAAPDVPFDFIQLRCWLLRNQNKRADQTSV